MALLSVRVFFKKCPPLISMLSSFPETVPRSLVQEAQGQCVEHAALQGLRARLPKLFCGEDGQWVGQPTTSCACLPGFEPVEMQTRCAGKMPDKKNMFCTRIYWQTKQENKEIWVGEYPGLKCLRKHMRRRKLMRLRHSGDSGKGHVELHSSLKRKSRVKGLLLRQPWVQQGPWRAKEFEGGGGGGGAAQEDGAPGKDGISLRTSKQSTQEKKQRMNLWGAVQQPPSNESN